MNNKTFVLDTNILIHEPTAFLSFAEHDVVIPMTVLEELDRIKDRKTDASQEAKRAIRSIEAVFQDATPEDIQNGVEMKVDSSIKKGKLSIFNDSMILSEEALILATGTAYIKKGEHDPDYIIMMTACYLQEILKDKSQVVLVTKDINMRLRSKSYGVRHVEDFRSDYVIDDVKFLAKGYQQFSGDFWQTVEALGEDVSSYTHDGETYHEISKKLFDSPYLNQYIVDESDEFLGRVVEIRESNVLIKDVGYNRLKNLKAWGIKPKNIQQGMALDALLDKNIDLVALTGMAGTGKTLLALAAAIDLVVEQKLYDKIIVTRSTPEISESIGFLPGTEEEKMAPWLSAISDSLEVLHKNDTNSASSIEYIIKKANIQFKSLNYIRGRSIQNAIVILDESQNNSHSQIKTIVTRCGENTKLIALGNLGQIDNKYLTPLNNGLTFMVDKFKDYEGSATVSLSGVMRSRLAAFAEENL